MHKYVLFVNYCLMIQVNYLLDQSGVIEGQGFEGLRGIVMISCPLRSSSQRTQGKATFSSNREISIGEKFHSLRSSRSGVRHLCIWLRRRCAVGSARDRILHTQKVKNPLEIGILFL